MTSSDNTTSKPRFLGPTAIAAIFCISAFLVSTLLFDRAFSAYDDGIAAEGARQVLRGAVPYRDFWALYAPGSYYVNALLIKLLGPSLLSMRVLLPLMVLVQAGMLFGILRRLVASRSACAAAALAYIAFIPIGITTANPMTDWLTAALAGAYCFVRWVEKPESRWAYACGAMLGISALFRQDGGVYAAFAFVVSATLLAPALGLSRWRAALAIAAPFIGIGAITIAYFASHGALGAMIQDTFVFAVVAFPHSRTVPYPKPWDRSLIMTPYYVSPSQGFVYQLFTFWLLPAVLVAFAAIALWRMGKGDAKGGNHSAYALACAAAVLYLMISVRPVGMRVSGSIVLGLVVFAAMSTDRSRPLRICARAMLALALIGFISYASVWVWGHRLYGRQKLTMRGGVYGGRGYTILIDMTSAYVRAHTRPEEKIFSGSPLIYFTAGRDPATRYFEPHPCLTDTPAIERLIVRDIERKRVRCVVRARDWVSDGWLTIEPNHQPRELIRYIQRNYKLDRSFGILAVYKRKTPFASPNAGTIANPARQYR